MPLISIEKTANMINGTSDPLSIEVLFTTFLLDGYTVPAALNRLQSVRLWLWSCPLKIGNCHHIMQ